MFLEGLGQNFQLFDVTDGALEGSCDQLFVSKECEKHMQTQLQLIVYRQRMHQASKCEFLDKLGLFS